MIEDYDQSMLGKRVIVDSYDCDCLSDEESGIIVKVDTSGCAYQVYGYDSGKTEWVYGEDLRLDKPITCSNSTLINHSLVYNTSTKEKSLELEYSILSLRYITGNPYARIVKNNKRTLLIL